jgi:hypothetical protein
MKITFKRGVMKNFSLIAVFCYGISLSVMLLCSYGMYANQDYMLSFMAGSLFIAGLIRLSLTVRRHKDI